MKGDIAQLAEGEAIAKNEKGSELSAHLESAYCQGDEKPAAGGCFQCAHYHELVKNVGTNLLCSRVRAHFGLGAGVGATSKSKNGCEDGLDLSVYFCAPLWIPLNRSRA